MTKTQISIRVSPDTLAAIDAEAERLGVSRGAIIDRWLAEAANRNAPQYRRSVEERLLIAAEHTVIAAKNRGTDWDITSALDAIISALRIVAGIDE